MVFPKKLDWNRFWSLVDESETIILTSHIRPDGDSLGSQLALQLAMEALGKTVFSINSDPVPPTLRFLDPDSRIRPLADLTGEEKERLRSADLLIAVDTSATAQLGKMAEFYLSPPRHSLPDGGEVVARVAVVDHHVQKNEFPAEYFVDSDAEAAGAIVFRALTAGEREITTKIANLLFVALATDTGWFRFASVKPETWEIVASLQRAGVRPADVYRVIYEGESLGRVRLTGRALMKTEPHFDGRLLLTSLLLSDFEAAGAHPSESEDIVNLTLKVGGSEMALIMVEQKKGGFKISFRSRCAVDCSQLAARFGGGGHAAAAGAFIDAPYAEAKEKLLAAVAEEREKVRAT